MKFDWQHFALMIAGICLSGLSMWKPQLATYTGPALAMLVGAGIFKWSPSYGPPDAKP